ncbi:MAG: MBL fold metallo-hydrolase, partial [Myxococcota bacterium]
PPDGHMGEYMASLRTLLKLEATALLPAHGVLIVGARQKLERYLAHRQEREDQVLRVLRGRGDTFTQALDLVSRVYADVPQALWPVAAFSLLAHLEHLVELGVVEREDDGFRALEFPQELR